MARKKDSGDEVDRAMMDDGSCEPARAAKGVETTPHQKPRPGGPVLAVYEGAPAARCDDLRSREVDVPVPAEHRLYVGDLVHLIPDGAPKHGGVLAKIVGVSAVDEIEGRVITTALLRVMA